MDETLITTDVELDALITDAETTPGDNFTGLLADAIDVSTALTIPPNLYLRPVNNGMLVNDGGTVEFEGEGISGNPYEIIFSGFDPGDVTWSGATPHTFYPEWWGAVGDGTTDDLNAFDCITFAVPAATAGGGVAIRVILNSAKNYKLSASWNVDSHMLVESNSSTLGAKITFPTNTIGIIAHYIATKTGSDNGRFQFRSQFRNLEVNGSTSYLQFTPHTHTVNVSGGFTVTKVTGDNFVAANGYGVGNTFTINGYSYVIDSVDSTTQITLREPVVVVWPTTGSPVVPSSGGFGLPTGGEWDGKTIEIDGANYTIDSIDGDEITLTSNYTGPRLGTPTDGYLTAGIGNMSGVNARINRFHGFDIRGPVILENCRVTGFAGNGISLGNSLTQGAPGGVSPNSNLSRIIGNECVFNAGSGYVTAGQNAAQCTFMNNDATANLGYGYLEMGGSGNNYFSNHSSFNYSGSTYVIQNGINQGIFLGEYTEGGSVSSTYAQHNTIIGGTPGAGFSKHNVGCLITTRAGQLRMSNLQFEKNLSTTNAKAFGIGIGDKNYSGHMMGFGACEEAANLYAAGNANNYQFPAYWLWYDPWGYAGWYIWHYKENALGSVDHPVYGVSGSEALEGGGRFAFFNGFRTGKTDPDVERILTATATLDFSSIGAGSTAEMTITVTDAAAGDSVVVSPPAGIEAGLIWSGYVSASNTVKVRLANVTGSSIDPASGTWRAVVTKFG
jgi:hypothetical protein